MVPGLPALFVATLTSSPSAHHAHRFSPFLTNPLSISPSQRFSAPIIIVHRILLLPILIPAHPPPSSSPCRCWTPPSCYALGVPWLPSRADSLGWVFTRGSGGEPRGVAAGGTGVGVVHPPIEAAGEGGNLPDANPLQDTRNSAEGTAVRAAKLHVQTARVTALGEDDRGMHNVTNRNRTTSDRPAGIGAPPRGDLWTATQDSGQDASAALLLLPLHSTQPTSQPAISDFVGVAAACTVVNGAGEKSTRQGRSVLRRARRNHDAVRTATSDDCVLSRRLKLPAGRSQEHGTQEDGQHLDSTARPARYRPPLVRSA